jgi:glucose dehydrogenase
MLEEILENHPDETFLKADGFDEAIIGLDETSGRLIYSVTKCIECLMEQGMTDEEASEYFYYNVSGAYMGEQTPIFCTEY